MNTTDDGRLPSGRAVVPDALAAKLRDLGEFLGKVEADIPEPTCPQIDAILKDIREPRRKADQLTRNKPDSRELEDFAVEVDDVLWGLPDALEQLRHDNAQLRDGVHHLGSYCHDAGRLLLEAAQAIEARSDETGTGSARQGESAVAESHAPKASPMTNPTTLSLNGARKAITRAHLGWWLDERCPELAELQAEHETHKAAIQANSDRLDRIAAVLERKAG